MSNTNKQPKVMWAIANDAEMQAWVGERLANQQKWSSERRMIDGVSRATKLICADADEPIEFNVDWQQYPTAEYMEEMMPVIKKRMQQFTDVMEDFGMGFLIGVKIPYVDKYELQTGYAVYQKNIVPDDFTSIEYQFNESYWKAISESKEVEELPEVATQNL